MERSLDLGLLSGALDGRTGLPTAAELQQLMANVEVQLLLRRAEISQELFDAAWYLHGVASVSQARQRYTLARQRQAFLVSAHIFDLALNEDQWTPTERLSFGFAAAIGYRRGGRDPNATAIMSRLRIDDFTRLRSRSLLKTLLEAGSELPGTNGSMDLSGQHLSIGPRRNEPAPQPLTLYLDDEPIATIAPQDHADLQAIIDTGLDLALNIEPGAQPWLLRIQLPFADVES